MKKNRPVDKLYKTIANAQKKLDAIRAKCKHKKTRMGLYSWRIGAVANAELCNKCDAVIPNNITLGSTVSMTDNTNQSPTINITTTDWWRQ